MKIFKLMSPHTCSPGLVHGTFLLELLSQVIHSFQTADLSQQPLFISFLHLLQTLPGIGNILGGADT